jgi:hypothetical protein
MRLHRTALVLLLGATAWGQADISGHQPTLETIVARMTRAQQDARAGVRPYAVTRYYELRSDAKPDKASTVTAEIRFQPPSTKDFTIQETKGADGERVVRKVLEHEREMASQWEKTAFTEANYSFALAGEDVLDGHRCYVLEMKPRREAKELIRGRVWVDAEQFNVRQVVGEPSKSPSFWIKHMEVTLRYADVQGMWLQTAASATADVRMMGRHVFTSRDMSYSTEMLAKNTKPAAPSSRAKLPAALGTAVIVPRH